MESEAPGEVDSVVGRGWRRPERGAGSWKVGRKRIGPSRSTFTNAAMDQRLASPLALSRPKSDQRLGDAQDVEGNGGGSRLVALLDFRRGQAFADGAGLPAPCFQLSPGGHLHHRSPRHDAHVLR